MAPLIGTDSMATNVKHFFSIACGLLALSSANADPCKGVGPKPFKADDALVKKVAETLDQKSVNVKFALRNNEWTILYVEPSAADGAFVFYSGVPSTSQPVTVWSGAARSDERPAIESWAIDNAKGIPPALASCFAFFVTQGRRE